MTVPYIAAKCKNIPEAAENARGAANWGLTVLTLTVLLMAYAALINVLLPIAADPFENQERLNDFYLRLQLENFGGTGMLVLWLVHICVTCAGIKNSGKGTHRSSYAIPYLRPSKRP
ncbi:MAG TPA: hypothetical protein VJP90_09370 [Paenarthrobacter sp.]|nr:hypothetical protein [Paenarthrobacter sp.]